MAKYRIDGKGTIVEIDLPRYHDDSPMWLEGDSLFIEIIAYRDDIKCIAPRGFIVDKENNSTMSRILAKYEDNPKINLSESCQWICRYWFDG